MAAPSELKYKSILTRRETERAIDLIKTRFPVMMAERLNLFKISCPLAIMDGTGINDDLNGIERPVRFPIKNQSDASAVVVQSLAKWKRWQLAELEAKEGEGILTDMRALRPDEDYSPLHSLYVDQWDWEQKISTTERNLDYLKAVVENIYGIFQELEKSINAAFPDLQPFLPDRITFIQAEELLQQYPGLSPKEREYEACKAYGAVFLIGIGDLLSNGEKHDGRAPDYDDWSSYNSEGHKGLNGDILVWNPVLQNSFELSSMGIRVDAPTLERQLKMSGEEKRKNLFFHQKLLNGELPQSIGGGIGQSRTCMFLLRKKHIGEVQSGIWPEDEVKKCLEEGIDLMK
ncbi:aspartate-ammonia ligase [Cyclobacterium lianum]|uniref:Aspartate--ammonia ligase n=1 Tax=Cyclobacterium lianum TaxID=388280 RepID=A0A1M7Q6R8_9BACT|nr:aspartate--ammonia ligase [Cyclobacterium lianum]SHN26213.1 aspartate-ammonia ligase [Cyclobacterium lianum]